MMELFFLPAGNIYCALLAGVFGLIIGSFLNVLIHRIPVMMQRESDNYLAELDGKELPHTDTYNIMVPRSACPHCGHQISALENIPVISYLWIGGKCTQCKAAISARYPLVELLTGLMSALLIWRLGSGYAGLASLLLAYFLISMSFIDADTQLLPDSLTQPLLWLGLLCNLRATYVPLNDAVVGAIAGYLILWSVYWVFKLLTGKEGMGYGDFKLLAALGAWMGWMVLPVIILLSSLVGALVGISMILSKRINRSTPIPFGPYLAAAGMICFIWGKPLTQWILMGMT
jgi:leader peptidase (prepilin peptidase)/N-methyltransferase